MHCIGNVPAFYGLPKVHKAGFPLCPIIDYKSSPLYKLSRFLPTMLKLLAVESVHNLTFAYQFLYYPTRILINFACEVIQKIWLNYTVDCNLEIVDRVCLTSNCFVSEEKKI